MAAVTSCCSTFSHVAGEHFDSRLAQRDLADYRRNGAGPTTRLLRDLLVETGGVEGLLLDIGSGIGALTFELLDRGITSAIAVDASAAHVAAASDESARRDKSGTIQFLHGDFLDHAATLPEANVVTLDRV